DQPKSAANLPCGSVPCPERLSEAKERTGAPLWPGFFLSGACGGGAKSGPALNASPVAGLPVGVFGLQEKAGIDGEVQRSFVLKANVDGVGLAGGVELDAVHDLAFHLFHVVDRASGITADGGFASAGDDRRR